MMKWSGKTNFQLFSAVLMILFTLSCDPDKKYKEEENTLIQNYLNNNSNLDFVLKPSGLYYLEVLAGSGPVPKTADSVYVKYTGKFLDGTIFDSNVGSTKIVFFPFNQGRLIAGFDEGLSYMKQGGKSIFLVPSYLGYGNSGKMMPAYTPLLFEVELVLIKSVP